LVLEAKKGLALHCDYNRNITVGIQYRRAEYEFAILLEVISQEIELFLTNLVKTSSSTHNILSISILGVSVRTPTI
jgi:hypothetical protein